MIPLIMHQAETSIPRIRTHAIDCPAWPPPRSRQPACHGTQHVPSQAAECLGTGLPPNTQPNMPRCGTAFTQKSGNGRNSTNLVGSQIKKRLDKMNKFVLFVAAIFVAFAASATAQVVISDLTLAERDAILADTDNTVVANNILRAGGSATYELAAGLGQNAVSDTDNVSWSRNNDHGFNQVYDGAGNLELTITPPSTSPISVSVAPGTWFNQLLFTIRSPGAVSLTLSGNIDSDNFRTLTSSAAGGSDTLSFDFSDFQAGDVGTFNISGVFTPNWPITTPPSGDAFRGELYLVQNPSIPEPSSVILLLSFLTIFLFKRPLRQS